MDNNTQECKHAISQNLKDTNVVLTHLYNERTNVVEESIHVVLDESNDGNVSLASFLDLNLSRQDDKEIVEANSTKATPSMSTLGYLEQI